MKRWDLRRWANLPLRLLVGYGFMEHGFAKLLRGPDAFAGILQQLGVPVPHVAAWLTICTEILGGLAVLLGFIVSWASIPMAAVLLVAMFSVHVPYGFSSVKLLSVSASGAKFGPVGYEVDLLYLAALVSLVLQGPGPFAIDNLRNSKAGERERAMEEASFSAGITIRPAVSEDAGGIGSTFLESAECHASLDPERYAAPTFETISSYYRETRQGVTLVAEFGGEIFGFVDAQLERSSDQMHRQLVYCHVSEIAVRQKRQNQGIGRRLLQAVEDWGRQHGAEFASLEYHAANTRAGAFYQRRMGYRLASVIAIKLL